MAKEDVSDGTAGERRGSIGLVLLVAVVLVASADAAWLSVVGSAIWFFLYPCFVAHLRVELGTAFDRMDLRHEL